VPFLISLTRELVDVGVDIAAPRGGRPWNCDGEDGTRVTPEPQALISQIAQAPARHDLGTQWGNHAFVVRSIGEGLSGVTG
jgi:hypothetical protein